MKKCWILVGLTLLLAGCSSAETFETVTDDVVLPAMAELRQVELELPDDAAAEIIGSDESQRLYLCEDYSLSVQTFESGDMEKTVRSLSGFSPDTLQILHTREGALKRSDWVWICAGEGGDQVGRCMVLDDGSYHYCLTAMAEASQVTALEEEWNRIFASFSLS